MKVGATIYGPLYGEPRVPTWDGIHLIGSLELQWKKFTSVNNNDGIIKYKKFISVNNHDDCL